ncbi:NEDD4-binding protein 2-like 1 isoform X2 [Erpetoichthys calabaricus]|uniref:NEDD4-binding protein 2-like 1 n=2 Tax=Erpetoichthys calabaricus TaxID=27687 RepID=A0A8C4RG89_ERPCA|nr:NEDD4-binding protein 2-like 1 isoform X2 [Erpetoichthys calabaricus]
MSLEELMGNLSLRPNNRHRGRRRRDRPKLFILRGLPGSGKSTLARQIRNEFGSAEIFSTDDFFRDESGRYHFKARELREAHEWNKERAKEAMEEGLNPIIIDNTNIHAWEMKPYVRMGLDNGYYIIFKEPETSWKNDIHRLHRKTQNGVPLDKIARMKEDFEPVSSIYDVLDSEPPSRFSSWH